MKKNRTVTFLLVLGLMVYAAVSLVTAASELRGAETLTAELQSGIEMVESENAELKKQAEGLNSDAAAKEFAEEFFGFSDPEKTVFEDRT